MRKPIPEDAPLIRRRDKPFSEPSPILETGSRAVFHTILVVSLFMFFSGHDAPGGGFISGLLAGGAFLIRYLALGADEVRSLIKVRPETVMGSGLLVAAGSGIASLAYGEAFESAFIEFRIPVVGVVALSSSLIFDIGVYLVVVGLVMRVLESLGAEARR